jgi:hypothetical protein
MVDFGQVGTASLWKSGPLFSTGTKEAELMLEELRLNPRSSWARTWGRCSGEAAGAGSRRGGSGLSTGFAERQRRRSTGPAGLIHGVSGAMAKEKVG